MQGRHRLVRLDSDFVVASELHDFLIAVVQNSQEYRDLADAGRPHIERLLAQ